MWPWHSPHQVISPVWTWDSPSCHISCLDLKLSITSYLQSGLETLHNVISLVWTRDSPSRHISSLDLRLSITSYLQSRLEQVVKYPLPRLLSDTNWTGLSYQLSLLSLTLLQQFKKFIERFFLCRINFRKHWNLVTLLAIIFNLCYKQNKTNHCEFKLNSKKKQSFTTIGHSGLVWEGAPHSTDIGSEI